MKMSTRDRRRARRELRHAARAAFKAKEFEDARKWRRAARNG